MGIDVQVPLYEQFDAAGNPQTDAAKAALAHYREAVENVASMTGGAALNGWSGVADPRERPCLRNSKASDTVATPQADAWDTSGPGNFIE